MEKDAPNLWTGLAPLAMGILMDDIGVGAGIGGQLMMDEGLRNRSSREKREMASMKAKDANQAKRGTYQWKNYEDDDGRIGLMKVNTATGESQDTDKTAGFAHRVGVDPVTGQLSRASKGSNTGARSLGTQKGLTIKEQKDEKEFLGNLMKDPVFSDNRETVVSTGRALSLLEAGNPIADAGIKTIFPRMFGEVGNLAAQEQERFSGSPAFFRKWESLKRKLDEGLLTNEDRADLIEVAQVMEAYSRRAMNQSADSFKRSQKLITGSTPTSADPFLNKESISSKDVVKKVKAKNPKVGKSQYKARPNPVRKGFVDVFELNALGEYEYKETVDKKKAK
jgi:hypothetical protein